MFHVIELEPLVQLLLTHLARIGLDLVEVVDVMLEYDPAVENRTCSIWTRRAK